MSQKDVLERLLEGRRKLLATSPDSLSGRALLLENTRIVDEAVRGIYELAAQKALEGGQETGGRRQGAGDRGQGARSRNAAGPDSSEAPSGKRRGDGAVAIIATGGYGRNELSPFSDIDIAFIPAEEDHPFADRLLREAFRLVVEIFLDNTDLQVGYAFRPVTDIPFLDHETKTALLDARVVAGSEEIGELLQGELMGRLDVAGFLREKVLERRAARTRAQSSLYSLEPNVKEGPGGLRDFQAAVWIARVKNGLQSGDALSQLMETGLLDAEEAAALEAALEFLWRLRNWLHLTARRKQDIFAQEYHDRAARELGASSADDLLERYYRHAEVVHHFSDKVSEALLEGRLELGDGFWAEGRKIFAELGHLQSRPQLLLRPFQLMHQYGFGLSQQVARRVEKTAARLDEEAMRSAEASSAFLSVLTSGAEAGRLLRKMHELGLLERYLPELGRVMRLAPSEPGHTLTVGEHCIVVAEHISSLTDPEADKPTQLADAMGQISDQEALILAALLHDVGKAAADRDHCEAGAELAREAAARMGFDAERAQRVGKLVREHLALPRTSLLRDTRDPATIRDVVEAVGDPETLHMLYLLAWADGRAVDQRAFGGPEARRFGTLSAAPGRAESATPSGVEGRLLDELYFRALGSMTAREEPVSVERMRAHLRSQLAAERISDAAVRQLLDSMPPRYLLNTPLSEISRHARFLEQLQATGKPVIDFGQQPARPQVGPDFTELTVCTYDDPQPGLLSKIAGALFANEVDISSARVFTSSSAPPVALDTLWISVRRQPVSEARASRIEQDLRQVLSGQLSVQELVRQRASPPEKLEPERLAARNDLSEDHTVIELVAGDRRGLLYLTTAVLSRRGLDIHSANIATWQGKAEDTYYVTLRGGGKVPDEQLDGLCEKLRAMLAQSFA
jgi:[protein-PII] uridylyltransferase